MRKIASQINLEPVAVIQYVIDGIQDMETNKVILYGATNFSEFKEKLRHYEVLKNKINASKQSSRLNPVKSIGKEEATNDSKSLARNSPCYNCGDSSHLSRNCTHRGDGPKCFRCKKFGHIAPQCPDIEKPRGAEDREKSTRPLLQLTVDSPNICSKKVKIDGMSVKCLIDSGSAYNIMREDLWQEMGMKHLEGPMETLTATGGGKICTKGQVKAVTSIDGINYPLVYRVVPTEAIPTKALLGADLLNHAIVQLSKDKTKIWPGEEYMLLVTPEDTNDGLAHVDSKYKEKAREIRYITFVFRNLIKAGVVLVYVDDVIILGKGYDEAIDRLRDTLEVAAQHGLIINWRKCQLLCRRIEFLGHSLRRNNSAIYGKSGGHDQFPSPNNSDVDSKLPWPSWLFHSKFKIDDEQRQAFTELKRALTTAPVLRLFNAKLRTEYYYSNIITESAR
ncbi:hypothetical protein KPH14_002454 [Odynerus spinipes]|uniref:CCHC-type domain-containing protein n=1 Tax=Odynerus spinipes TaxID=1348599 RepID=A0AAD9VLL1_9HYME|nr:hypothetical protein KPH14_002454 [Odynerus spinipes]